MINLQGLTLLIPDKPDAERDAVGIAWISAGGHVVRIGRFWDPPELDPALVRVYGNDTFCLVLQQRLGLRLETAADDLLLQLSPEQVRRNLHASTIADLSSLAYPAFVKPMAPKLFRARVYENIAAIAEECRGLPNDTPIIVSEPVVFAAEVRCFVLDGRILDCAVYDGDLGVRVNDASALAEHVAQTPGMPRAVVVDIGLIADDGWAVIEFNAAWGAGLNGCRAQRVLACIEAASAPC